MNDFQRAAALQQATQPLARCDSIAEVVFGVLRPRTKSAQAVSAMCSTLLSKMGICEGRSRARFRLSFHKGRQAAQKI
jgi:hypothetical protein